MSESTKPYNPWREFIENCISGDNYFRASEYRELLEYIDDLLAASNPAPVEQAAPVTVPNDLRRIGAQMATVMFNLAQKAGDPLTGDDCAILDSLRKQWDHALAAAPAAPSADAQDAKRYRWLTQHAYIGRCFTERGTVFVVSNVEREVPVNEDYPSVSAAIDAALSAQQKEGE